MSTLAYQGISIEIVRTLQYSRRVLYDSAYTYLWTEHLIHVEGIYNPFATSYKFQGDPNVIVAEPGVNPAFTDHSIRHKLMQPRGHLIYTAAGPGADGKPAIFRDGFGGGSLVILDVPESNNPDQPDPVAGTDYLTDTNSGPFVVDCDVAEIGSTKTWRVRIKIRVALNECFYYYNNPAVVLSHRWRDVHRLDQDAYLTRYVTGHVIFRSDVLLQNKWNPDDFRGQFLHPLRPGMKRVGLELIPHEGGTRLDYSFRDVEQPTVVTARNATRIEAFARVGLRQPGTEAQVKALLRPFLGGAGNLLNFLGSVEALLPQLNITLTVRVWGNRLSRNADLLAVAVKTLMVKFPQGFADADAFTQSGEATFDLMGRFVQVVMSFAAGPIGNALENLGADSLSRFPELLDNEIPEVATTRRVPWSTLPNGRGTELAAAVSQSLGVPCKAPNPPVNLPANNRTFSGS